jgi:hypothetical protein
LVYLLVFVLVKAKMQKTLDKQASASSFEFSVRCEDDESRKHVMISYSWANKKKVNEIVSQLEPFLFIWRDKANLTGAKDLWTA